MTPSETRKGGFEGWTTPAGARILEPSNPVSPEPRTMSDPAFPPPDLKNAHALDPALLARAQADAARMVAALPRDHAPEEEPAHTYLADMNP